jgi:hypothetical protein
MGPSHLAKRREIRLPKVWDDPHTVSQPQNIKPRPADERTIRFGMRRSGSSDFTPVSGRRTFVRCGLAGLARSLTAASARSDRSKGAKETVGGHVFRGLVFEPLLTNAAVRVDWRLT